MSKAQAKFDFSVHYPFKVRWVLIGYQCFHLLSAGKKLFWKKI